MIDSMFNIPEWMVDFVILMHLTGLDAKSEP